MDLTSLKGDIWKATAPIVANIESSQKARAKIEKRIADEMNTVRSLQQRIEDLNATAAGSLLGDRNNYEKYRIAITKLTAQLATAESIVKTFVEELLPREKQRLIDLTRELDAAILKLATEKKADIEGELTEILSQAIEARDAYLLAWEVSCSDCGTSFPMGRPGAVPQLRHERIDPKRPGCAVIALSAEVRAERVQKMREERKAP